MADEKYTIAVNLEAGQTVEGDSSISGAENDIDFYITDPSGWLACDVERVTGGGEFAVEAKDSGTHTLWFDNAFSGGKSREITLHYRSRLKYLGNL